MLYARLNVGRPTMASIEALNVIYDSSVSVTNTPLGNTMVFEHDIAVPSSSTGMKSKQILRGTAAPVTWHRNAINSKIYNKEYYETRRNWS